VILHEGAEALLLAHLPREAVGGTERAAMTLVRGAASETLADVGVATVVVERDAEAALRGAEAVAPAPLGRRAVRVRRGRALAAVLAARTAFLAAGERAAALVRGAAVLAGELAATVLFTSARATAIPFVGRDAFSSALGAEAARLAFELTAVGVLRLAGRARERRSSQKEEKRVSHGKLECVRKREPKNTYLIAGHTCMFRAPLGTMPNVAFRSGHTNEETPRSVCPLFFYCSLRRVRLPRARPAR